MKPITDDLLLEWIRTGIIEVCLETLTVFSWLSGKKNRLTPQTSHNGRTQIKFYRRKNGQRRTRTISLNRLVFLVKTGQPIPDGHDIDHIDMQRTNDMPDNLRARPARENRSANGRWHPDFRPKSDTFNPRTWNMGPEERLHHEFMMS